MQKHSISQPTWFTNRIIMLVITSLFWLLATIADAQNMDEKIKTLASEIADQVVKGGKKKVAVASLLYKDCPTEFGNLLAEKLTGRLAVSGRNLTVVNQRLLESLLAQNKLSVTGILEARNEAAKLGQVSGIDALVYGTISGTGDEVQLTLNIITLSTLNVFGFAETSFPLTQGIKSMLPCLQGLSGPQTSDKAEDPNNSAPKDKGVCRGLNPSGILLTIDKCSLTNRVISCQMTVLNNRQDKIDASFKYFSGQTYIITDSGNQYHAYLMEIGNTGSRGYDLSRSEYTSLYGTKVTGAMHFETQDNSVKSLQIFEMKDQGIRCLNLPVTSSSSK